MRQWIWLVCLLCLVSALPGQSSKPITAEEYVEMYKHIAISEMHRTGIPASIKLAQGILESGAGNSRLAREANNHFGIKCHKEWTGPSIREDDDAPQECFRKYGNPMESWVDHSEFLMTRTRYEGLFKLDHTDYEAWARGLKAAGYATNPQYAPLLTGIIERMELHQFDHASPGEMPVLASREPNKNGSQPASQATKTYNYRKGVFETNRIKTVFLQPDQKLAEVARENGLREAQLIRWNEVEDASSLKAGMRIFLAPKRNKAQAKHHKVQEGESMYDVSQNYGIKLAKLYTYNLMEPGSQPAAGERLYLRNKRNGPPKLKATGTKAAAQIKELAQTITKEKEPQVKQTEALPNVEPVQVEPIATVQKQPESQAKSKLPPATEEPRYTYRGTGNPGKEISTPSPQQGKPESPEPSVDVPSVVTSAQPNDAVSGESGSQAALPARMHTVAQGETLYSLSRKYGTTIHRLMQLNQMDSTSISIGQELIVDIGE